MTRSIDMSREGIWVEDVKIPAVVPEHYSEKVEDLDGSIYLSTYLKERPITAYLQFEILDGTSITTYNRHLSGLFNPKEQYYLVIDEDPSIRYSVRISNGYEIDELSWEDGKFEIEFIMFNPLRESINLVKKSFTISSFNFKNGGNQLIDMTKQNETEITFKGASTNLTITNETTGDVWRYNGSTTELEIIKLKGVQAFKNESSIFGQTNKKLLSFEVGNNEFTVSGASGEFELTISTRFYFL
ncbi:phage tail domain-containing protein [Psychrobacillus sp. FSL K6-2365]|uniref:phage tail domain-containing protein n=1 Tax=Psychrobacillus sp. FSL K6-2365 TaxID=2921546 RepID=UPI0030F7B896